DRTFRVPRASHHDFVHSSRRTLAEAWRWCESAATFDLRREESSDRRPGPWRLRGATARTRRRGAPPRARRHARRDRPQYGAGPPREARAGADARDDGPPRARARRRRRAPQGRGHGLPRAQLLDLEPEPVALGRARHGGTRTLGGVLGLGDA